MTQHTFQAQFVKIFGKEEWPSYSPDLNPLDYSIWCILDSRACATCHTNLACFRAAFIKAWDKIPEDTLRRVDDNFSKRFDACIKNCDRYIENTLKNEFVVHLFICLCIIFACWTWFEIKNLYFVCARTLLSPCIYSLQKYTLRLIFIE